ncbi:hypothetical protein SBA4_270004 [Candidatus Sulfopaludibacter sp. SbA4]|nr:hypothetical protein SBA4_270004 [Candidatus Sulfopaludibacter sp. SbA4]
MTGRMSLITSAIGSASEGGCSFRAIRARRQSNGAAISTGVRLGRTYTTLTAVFAPTVVIGFPMIQVRILLSTFVLRPFTQMKLTSGVITDSFVPR